MLAEHEAIKHEVGSLRELMEEMDMSRRRSGNPSGRHQYGHDDDMAHDQHYMSDDDDNVHSISTIVPHELDQVNKEDEEQLAVEEEEEQRRRRREELGCPRTPEPTGMGMSDDGHDHDHDHSRYEPQQRTRLPSPLPAAAPAPIRAGARSNFSMQQCRRLGRGCGTR